MKLNTMNIFIYRLMNCINNIKILFAVMLFAVNTSVFSQEKPQIIWKEKIHDLNQVSLKDSLVETIFLFSVKGKTPLIIHNVSASCGCTTVDWIKYPVKPGGQGYVKVFFRTKGQTGYFDKRLIVESNAQKRTELLRIKGTVKQ